jgi:hypothetical protein
VISSRRQAPTVGGGLLLVDGTETTVHRKVGFAFTPSRKTAYALDRLLGLCQETYNASLQERRDAWRHPSQTKVTWVEQFLQLTDLREERPEVFQFGLQPIRSAIKRVDEAYTAFFDRVKNGQTPASHGLSPGDGTTRSAGTSRPAGRSRPSPTSRRPRATVPSRAGLPVRAGRRSRCSSSFKVLGRSA